jgi:prepilin-type N-terminal cleavage/methylation domain-containing protein
MKMLAHLTAVSRNMPHPVNGSVPKTVTLSDESSYAGESVSGESGFSLVELVVVCVVIGIIATIAIPYLQKAVRSSENGNMFASMRTIASTQVNFYSQNQRFGRLGEINTALSNSIGTVSGNDLQRGRFVLSMSPAVPTDIELRTGYTITALRNIAGEDQIYRYELTQAGQVRQLSP